MAEVAAVERLALPSVLLDHQALVEDGDPAQVVRRAIQLRFRGDVLARFAKEWLLDIEDISKIVAEQRASSSSPYERLVTPREDIYPVAVPEVASRLGISSPEDGR